MRAWTKADSLSRRLFMGCGTAAALAPQMAKAQVLAPVAPGTPSDEDARVAATNDSAKRLTIPVKIGGRGPFHFVVDTGADRSVIADDVATSPGLVRGADVTVQGVVRTLATRYAAVADISFGNMRRNLVMPILPRALMQADGYLGLDAVDGSRVVLDFKASQLEIDRMRPSFFYRVSRGDEAFVPVRGSMGHLRSMNCRVDGVPTTCFLDTGAEISVGNSRLFDALMAEDPTHKVYGTVPITGITGGSIMGRIVEIDRIRLHSVNFADAVIAIADMQIFDVWGLSKEPALLIGMNFLRQFAKVSIDYGMKEIRFNLASLMVARGG